MTKLYPKQEFNIARAHHVVSFWMVFGVCDCGASLFFFKCPWTTRNTDTVSLAVLSVNKYKFFIDPSVVVTCKIKCSKLNSLHGSMLFSFHSIQHTEYTPQKKQQKQNIINTIRLFNLSQFWNFGDKVAVFGTTRRTWDTFK